MSHPPFDADTRAAPPHADEVDAQRKYFDARDNVRMHALDTPYIHRHCDEVLDAAGVSAGQSVCEWGAGMGRFSRLLAMARLKVTAIELSPLRAEDCRAALSGFADAQVVCGDIASSLASSAQRYDAMLGFFVLHHLPELGAYLRAARAALRPGGRAVFVEPNPFNPLYPLQIALSPGMSWNAERGIYRLWPQSIRGAALEAGFSTVRIDRYGLWPRVVYNAAARVRCERWPEQMIPPPLRAFQRIILQA